MPPHLVSGFHRQPVGWQAFLAWANLGALVEGTLKVMLAVHLETYQDDVDRILYRGKTVEPESAMLEKLRVFFAERIWVEGDPWDAWIRIIQERRNAIHHFKGRPIGTWKEYESNVRVYLCFASQVNSRLSYPDDFPISIVLTDSSYLQADECICLALNSSTLDANETK